MRQFDSRIVENRQIADGFFEMKLRRPRDADVDAPTPGQFLTIRITDDNVPLLRRPFAVAGVDKDAHVMSIIYQARGRGTEIMSNKKIGDTIDVIAPLGNAFPVDGVKKAVVVAGGVGLGPMLFLANEFARRGVDTNFIFGCRHKSYIPKIEEFVLTNGAVKIHTCTDDGSAGFRGNVVEFINASVKIDDATVVYGCGPTVMLKNLCEYARSSQTSNANIRVYVSLEEMMACGVGACMGCAVPIVKQDKAYACVCKDGAVFDGRDISWERM